MKRVLIIGCPGSGKSTFARALAEKTGLPLYHLDLLYWRADRTTVDKAVFRARLAELLARDTWIMDGNYGDTMALRLGYADTVFFLDLPTEVCLAGIRARRGKPRTDLPWIEEEEDEDFMRFVEAYATDSRPRVMSLLADCPQKQITVFHSREEIDTYISAF